MKIDSKNSLDLLKTFLKGQPHLFSSLTDTKLYKVMNFLSIRIMCH